MSLIVSMPYRNTPDLVARAVRSVLNQTHRDLRLVVVNDGGGAQAWQPLRRFRDDRLVRFDLDTSQGRYYADAVTLGASDSEWWTPHDSDDWSERSRYAALFDRALNVDVVLAGITTHHKSGRVVARVPKIHSPGRLRYQASHFALWRTEGLRSIGGPHPDWRIAYDTLQVGFATRYLKVAVSDDVSYHHEDRPDSLTMSNETGLHSAVRSGVHRKRQRIWMGSQSMDVTALRQLIAPKPETAERLAEDIDRLRQLL